MSSYILKQVTKFCAVKLFGTSHPLKIGLLEEDPYVEPIPEDELRFYQKRGKTKPRHIPDYIPLETKNSLLEVRDWCYWMDRYFSKFGMWIGFGAIIGIIPVIGGFSVLAINLWIFYKMLKVQQVHITIAGQMLGNVLIDFGIGLIPFVGDFINIAYKANTRNYVLLWKCVNRKYMNTAQEVRSQQRKRSILIDNEPVTI